MNAVCCPNCQHQIRSDEDVMAEFLGRVMPPRANAALRSGQLRELAEEALAIARALGYVKIPSHTPSPDTRRNQ